MSKREIVEKHRMVEFMDTLVLVDKRLVSFPSGLFDLQTDSDVFDLLHVVESVVYWKKDLVLCVNEKVDVGQYLPKVVLESVSLGIFLQTLPMSVQLSVQEFF